MDCPHIPIIPYHIFGERIYVKGIKGRIPLVGGIELTERCNLKCAHCYIAHDPKKKEMSSEQIFRVLDEITDAGCLWFLITGGEPLMRDDFLDIYTYTKKKGLIVTLFTNGTLITPEIADCLKEYTPLMIEITIYGNTKETHEKVTGVPGSFKRCQEGIDLLLEREIPLKLKTMVMTLNKDELCDMKEYAEELGVEFRFDPVLNPRLDGSKDPCSLRISPEEVIELDIADEKRIKEWREFCKKFLGPSESRNLYICGAGVSSFHVDAYGKLSICIMSRYKSYDLLQGSFKEGWNGFIPQFLNQKPKNEYKCGQCELISLCGQCPGWAWLECGDPEAPVEYLCQIAHLRAEAFNIKKL
jgi:radical SAM protein with 4Fe4S-binding SPASM domain